jgi:hypothetical protein
MLAPFSRTPLRGLSDANRLYFAEQIPQLAKSQAERRTLPKEEGIQDKGSSHANRLARKRSRRTQEGQNGFCKGEGLEATQVDYWGISQKVVFRRLPVFHCQS